MSTCIKVFGKGENERKKDGEESEWEGKGKGLGLISMRMLFIYVGAFEFFAFRGFVCDYIKMSFTSPHLVQ